MFVVIGRPVARELVNEVERRALRQCRRSGAVRQVEGSDIAEHRIVLSGNAINVRSGLSPPNQEEEKTYYGMHTVDDAGDAECRMGYWRNYSDLLILEFGQVGHTARESFVKVDWKYTERGDALELSKWKRANPDLTLVKGRLTHCRCFVLKSALVAEVARV
jgi:hypothetical protein